jgi:hypothetical protein
MTTGIETKQDSAAKRDWESAPLSELTGAARTHPR